MLAELPLSFFSLGFNVVPLSFKPRLASSEDVIFALTHSRAASFVFLLAFWLWDVRFRTVQFDGRVCGESE